jgi:hypothetical protein
MRELYRYTCDSKGLLTLLEVLGVRMNELESGEFKAALFKTADDVADKTALDAVGLE